jgi:hypothetical protein
MKNITSIDMFLEGQLNYDDVDYQGVMMKAKETQERESKKLDLLTSVDQLKEILHSIGLITQDLDRMEIETDRLNTLYYELASIIKTISE